jgi:DNA-binding PadR family transcriptional regulator
MEQEGLLRSEWQGEEGERRRKFYTITAEGRRRLAEEIQDWRSFALTVNRLLGAESAG